MNRSKFVRTVDLFCGCGGLSLGFELADNGIKFETALAIDNDASVLRVYNQNDHRRANRHPSGYLTGRAADITWFAHRSEFLLYFLSHMAHWLPDDDLQQKLRAAGFFEFLSRLRAIDTKYSALLGELAATPRFKEALDSVDRSSLSLALVKGVLGRLCFSSVRTLSLSLEKLPWTEEYSLLGLEQVGEIEEIHNELSESAASIWSVEMDRLRKARQGSGQGQHKTVAAKVAGIEQLFGGALGKQIASIWTEWRALRDSVRATYCLSVEKELDELYTAERRVDLVLGGPPCKGWSRIGRAVIGSLREQGVHAWASHDFGDERNALLHNYALALDALQPSVFLFENVAHFKSTLKTPAGKIHAATELANAINDLNSRVTYQVSSDIVRAREHAVPQDRERFIMIGMKEEKIGASPVESFFRELRRYETEVPLKTALLGLDDPHVFEHGSKTTPRPKMRVKAHTLLANTLPVADQDFIKWIRQSRRAAGRTGPATVDAHIIRAPRSDDAAFFSLIGPGKRWMDYKFDGLPIVTELNAVVKAFREYQSKRNLKALPAVKALEDLEAKLDSSFLLRTLLEASSNCEEGTATHHLLSHGYLRKGTDHHGDWLERLPPDRPCKTIMAHIGKDTYGYVHPFQTRALSIREAARVQSFPDFFEFGSAGIVDGYSMIGNAVPPLLAKSFADALALLDANHSLFELDDPDGSSSEESQLSLISVVSAS